jgi:aspartate/methionine/tyrosine aminotransferase
LKIWKERRDLIYEGLINLGLDLWKPEGAFYVLPNIKNSRDFVWNMFKKYHVITYLGEWFGAKDRVRFSYALDKENIEEGLKRVKRYLEKQTK